MATIRDANVQTTEDFAGIYWEVKWSYIYIVLLPLLLRIFDMFFFSQCCHWPDKPKNLLFRWTIQAEKPCVVTGGISAQSKVGFSRYCGHGEWYVVGWRRYGKLTFFCTHFMMEMFTFFIFVRRPRIHPASCSITSPVTPTYKRGSSKKFTRSFRTIAQMRLPPHICSITYRTRVLCSRNCSA